MKSIALIVITALTLNTTGFAYQTTPPPEGSPAQAQNVEKTKTEVERRGVGSRVKVRLRDHGDEVKGYISHIDETSFQVTEQKTGNVTTVAYADVKKVRGSGMSLGAKIAIGVGVAAVALIAAILLSLKLSGE